MSGQQPQRQKREEEDDDAVPVISTAASTGESAPLLVLRHPHHHPSSGVGGSHEASMPSSSSGTTTEGHVSPDHASSSSWAHPLMRHISILQRYDSTWSDDNDSNYNDHNRRQNNNHDHHHSSWWERVVRGWRSASLQTAGAVASSCGNKAPPCGRRTGVSPRTLHLSLFVMLAASALLAFEILGRRYRRRSVHGGIIPIEHAQEHYIRLGRHRDDADDDDLDDDDDATRHAHLHIWCRTWGNPRTGIPVLFVHGGPGNAISDYGTSNARFFDATKFFVIEVDQRGTGKSTPSVRESCRNMRHYTSISIAQMSHDFEVVRKHFNIDRWLVFGGSWGSTLSLDYGMRYPDRALSLIIRGIYLNTKEEFDAVYTRNAFLNHPQRLHEFDEWFQRAQERSHRDGDGSLLDPNDPKRFFEVYRRMLLDCDRSAIWHWYVFENNLMETVPEDLRDPYKIRRSDYPEAQSVAFFENVLFYHGTFVDPPRLLERLDHLQDVPVWICQGNFDEVCPPQYAHKLVDAMEVANVTVHSHFVDSGHEASEPVMAECLVRRVDDFLRHYHPSLD